MENTDFMGAKQTAGEFGSQPEIEIIDPVIENSLPEQETQIVTEETENYEDNTITMEQIQATLGEDISIEEWCRINNKTVDQLAEEIKKYSDLLEEFTDEEEQVAPTVMESTVPRI